jgi:aryl-alcohol dehydrogenase-like predicted oxidoreductase
MIVDGSDFGDIGLGTAQFAFKDVDERQAIDTIRAGLADGIRLIDTALAYNRPGSVSYAEHVVRLALAGIDSDNVIVATKGGHFRSGDIFPVDGTRATLRAHCETSLTALGVERIDLYQLHRVDPRVPIGESVASLAELRVEGKVKWIGVSNVSLEQLREAASITSITSVQNELSFHHPDDPRVIDFCRDNGMAYLAYAPFGGPDRSAARVSDARADVARERGVSWQQVTLAWLRSLDPCILPLVGSSRPDTIRDSAADLRLDASDLARLNAEDR